MNAIAAELRQTRYAAEPHLHLIIDGQPLDALLHHYYPQGNYLGLLPTLLSWLDYAPDREVVWQRVARQFNNRTILPLLMCPDDLDLSCTVIVAEVEAQNDVVQWFRIGWDASTSSDPADCGREVEWLTLVPPLAFTRAEYQRCLDAFAAVLNEQ